MRQPVCNLFGGPALREQAEDGGAQAGLDRELPRLVRLVDPALRALVCGHRAVGDWWRVSSRDRVLGARLSTCPMARRLAPAANMRLNSSRSTTLKR